MDFIDVLFSGFSVVAAGTGERKESNDLISTRVVIISCTNDNTATYVKINNVIIPQNLHGDIRNSRNAGKLRACIMNTFGVGGAWVLG